MFNLLFNELFLLIPTYGMPMYGLVAEWLSLVEPCSTNPYPGHPEYYVCSVKCRLLSGLRCPWECWY